MALQNISLSKLKIVSFLFFVFFCGGAFGEKYSSTPSDDMLNEARKIISGSEKSDSYSQKDLIDKPKNVVEDLSKSSPGRSQNPSSNGSENMYIFVSSSMPKNLIRSYAYDALLTGATLVIKGITKDSEVSKTIKKWQSIIRHKSGATPEMIMDPRGFQAFSVETVPSIVISKKSIKDSCDLKKTNIPTPHRSSSIPYQVCQTAPKDSYYKINGVVSLRWAVKRMATTEKSPDIQKEAKAINKKITDNSWFPEDENGWAKSVPKGNYKESPLPSSRKTFEKNREAIKNWRDAKESVSDAPLP